MKNYNAEQIYAICIVTLFAIIGILTPNIIRVVNSDTVSFYIPQQATVGNTTPPSPPPTTPPDLPILITTILNILMIAGIIGSIVKGWLWRRKYRKSRTPIIMPCESKN